jgi:pimeloyl-ACP methyl ester carboxylesterase
MLIPVLFFLFVFLIFRGMRNPDSIYRTPEVQKKLMRIYDERLNRWPVPYESRYLNTPYGKVHIIISGPETGPPVLLLHASAMASWSWLYNIKGLNDYYRTYAIDTIGEAGRSILADIRHFPNDGRSIASFCSEIMDSLGIGRATLIGASQGGFIVTNIALHRSERVNRVILCGPMGYTGTNSSVLRILFTTMFPLKAIQTSVTHWGFGDDPRINREVGEWFTLILVGVISRQARPVPFTKEQLQSLKMPVLLLLGNRDALVVDFINR